MYAYESTSPEELTIDADVDLNVYAEEDDWILVSVVGAEHTLGFVPKNYCEPLDGAADEDDDGGQGAAVGAAVAAGGVTAAAAAAAAAAARQDDERARAAAKQRELALKDKVESWSISELDGKKKKKGSLSVGNGTIFFSSDSDKVCYFNLTVTADFISVPDQAVPHLGPHPRRAGRLKGHRSQHLGPAVAAQVPHRQRQDDPGDR